MSDILEDVPWWRTEIDRLRARVAELEAKNIIGKYKFLGDSRELEIWQKLWDRAERAERAEAECEELRSEEVFARLEARVKRAEAEIQQAVSNAISDVTHDTVVPLRIRVEQLEARNAKLEKAVWAISLHQPDQCLDAEWRALIQTIKEYAIDSLQEVTA